VNDVRNNNNQLVALFTPSQLKGKVRMKNRTSNNKGFTLVEIMIVVAIIGLLAAIAIPNFVRARTQSQKNACINNLRQIDGAVQQWALENKQAATVTPSTSDVLAYLKSSVICLSGGTTFADSYSLGAVSAKPSCLKLPGAGLHELPTDTSN
jgi:prepilin-type N-terminal cleavage/methylation domain-containing protein